MSFYTRSYFEFISKLIWGREFIWKLIQICEKALEWPVFQFVEHITPITVWTYVKISFCTAKGKQERDYELKLTIYFKQICQLIFSITVVVYCILLGHFLDCYQFLCFCSKDLFVSVFASFFQLEAAELLSWLLKSLKASLLKQTFILLGVIIWSLLIVSLFPLYFSGCWWIRSVYSGWCCLCSECWRFCCKFPWFLVNLDSVPRE